jgi:outer membrane protein OmpA-like peptidoglycan-associated protein
MRAVIILLIVAVANAALAMDATKNLVVRTKELNFTVKDLDLQIEEMIRVKEAPKEITIELPADILFDFDKADIRPEAAIALASAAKLIGENARGTFNISGHTDAKGSASHNKKLSDERAKSVSKWLVEKGGLAKIKFALKGLGASNPVAPNTKPDGSDDPEGRQLNRRVEIFFLRK